MLKAIFLVALFFGNFLEIYNFCSTIRPSELINAEIYCTEEVKDDIFDRIENTAKSIFNRAKQELGLKIADHSGEPKKCEHYVCIFERLEMMSQLRLPDLNLIQKWIGKNVEESTVQDLNEHVANCFQELATSTKRARNTCEIALRLMMCMHDDKKCEIFQFP